MSSLPALFEISYTLSFILPAEVIGYQADPVSIFHVAFIEDTEMLAQTIKYEHKRTEEH